MLWIDTLKFAWQQAKELKSFMQVATKQVRSLEEITAKRLDDANIAILVLDFDGVLAPFGYSEPSMAAQQWLRQLSQEIGETRIAIFSNRPTAARIQYFTQHFPSIYIIYGVPKKPYPDGLLAIAAYRGVPPSRVLLVDDRLLTGMLSTCLSYTQGWYFYPPKINFWRHPIREVFFAFLRGCERMIIKMIG